MSFRAAIVVTSINQGGFLDNYARQIEQEGWADACTIIVIPDHKTSPELYAAVARIRSRGVQVLCPAPAEQEIYLRRLGPVAGMIPYNSCNRRNVGFLMAYEGGYDFVVSMDDDNFCLPDQPFFAEHQVVCQPAVEVELVHNDRGWFNVCDLLTLDKPGVFPRGFPYAPRQHEAHNYFEKSSGAVHLNAGLWLRDPDLDALTWLTNPAQAVSFKGRSVVLGPDTWTPINTQNTAINRELVHCYYYFRMNDHIKGIPIQRYGDIFSGYFSQACVKHLGYLIRLGSPVVEHARHTHNYLQDLTGEMPGIWLIEDISRWLCGVKLSGNNYGQTYLCLAQMLDEEVERFSGAIWDDSSRRYFHQMADNMRRWIKALEILNGAGV